MRLQDGLLAAAAVSVALGTAECGLRLFYPPVHRHFVLVPGTEWTVHAAPDVIPGVYGINHFRANAFGIRGPAFGDSGTEYRILAVGGSTTACVVLDDTKAWPHLLGVALGGTADGRRVWVGNVGRSGATSRDNVLHLKYLLAELPRMDAVVVLVGFNDLASALQRGWGYQLPAPITDPATERERLPLAFSLLPGRLESPQAYYGSRAVPWYKATALWQLAHRAKMMRGERERFGNLDAKAKIALEQMRRRRHEAQLIDSLPPLGLPLSEFRRNLNTMADIAAAAHVRLVFLTQPSLWHDRMSAAEQRLLWLGSVDAGSGGRPTYFSTGALARAMVTFNEAVTRVCSERHVECVDAAAQIPRDTSMMWDEVHFTEAGSLQFARLLASYLKDRPPWATGALP